MSLTDRFDEQHAQLAAIKASEAELTEGPDAALAVLGPPTDPVRMRATLGILLRAERHQQAADLIRDQPPDEKWLELGALVLAFLGDCDRARKMIDRADECQDPRVMRRTRLGFAEGVIQQWQKHCGAGSLLAPRDWSDSDADLARTVIEVLDPLLSLVRANRRIQGDLELGAVTYAVYGARITGEQQLLTQYTGSLMKHVPVPPMVAELCLRGLIQCPDNLPNRLRAEHPGDFQSAFLAALVEREPLGRSEEAFDALVHLASEGKGENDKESVSLALVETCGACAPHRIDQAIEIVTRLRPKDSRHAALLGIFKQVAAGNLAEARSRLDDIRDEADAVWWQAQAQVCEKAGDEDGAQAAWERASELLPHPDILRHSVQASLDRRRFESAVRGLKKLLADAPNSEQDLRALAWTLIQLGDFAQAESYLSRLVAANPASTEYRLGLAQCLARSARPAEAVAALQPVCDSEEPPIDAILMQSELLEADGRAPEAFQILESIAADHWDEPQFLLRYMHRAHAANQDRLAHEAFVRVVELRRQGKVPAELMQETTLEQLLEYGKDYRRRREALQQEVVGGRMPWLFVEDMLGNPPTWAWTLHTQEVKWLSEEPLACASLTVYATNWFTVQVAATGRRIEAISASPPGLEVVADLSALVTLHQLGQLDRAAEFFGKLILPASFGDLRIHDAGRFGQHQPSRETELKRIRGELDRGCVHVAGGDDTGLIPVDEYSDNPDRHVYRLRDFIAPLQAAQKAPTHAIEELRRVAHRPIAVDQDHPALAVGANLLVDLATLRTLARQPVFESVVDAFAVHLSPAQREELVGELRAYETARDARRAHDSLWDIVSGMVARGRAMWEPVPHAAQCDDDCGTDPLPSVPLDAIKLAQHLAKPVIVDDRVLQVAMYQCDPASTSRAFSTPHILLAMLDAGCCTRQAVAADFRRLMRWRYRFLVPPPALLLAWARESIDNLPGDALLDVAAYLHDCLRDHGLHCGPEESTPPMPMAVKLMTSWLDSIMRFLADVWADDAFSNDAASYLTRWIGEEFIPSCPLGLGFSPVGQRLARVGSDAALRMAMVQMTGVQDQRRANLGLRTLAEALGVDDDAFLTVAAEAIRGIA